MGDAGALFLGLLMAAATMEIGGRTEGVSGQTYFFYAPLFLPLFILGVPIADMAFAYVRRMAKGTSIDTPDNDHVHHRLVRLGHGPRRTVVILWTWTAALSGFVLFPLFARGVQRHYPVRCDHLGPAAVHLVPPWPAQRPEKAWGRGAHQSQDPSRSAGAGSAGNWDHHGARGCVRKRCFAKQQHDTTGRSPARRRRTRAEDRPELIRPRRAAPSDQPVAPLFRSRGRKAPELSGALWREPRASAGGRRACWAR